MYTLSCIVLRVSKPKLLERFLVRATVASVEHITPRMRRIRLTGGSLHRLEWTPGQHVRVLVDAVRLRSYSVWEHSPDGYLDLCVLDHPGAGPGARWSREVSAGQTVAFTKPQGRLVPRDAAYHLFAGDETAAVAFGPMLHALPAGVSFGIVELQGPDDRLPLPFTDVRWLDRNGPDGLVDAVRALDLPAEPGVAYLAGEARACQAVRRHLIAERGWPRRSVLVKPFWTPGKRGLD
jgi:NADPH-dependent ferric siderophore reductase